MNRKDLRMVLYTKSKLSYSRNNDFEPSHKTTKETFTGYFHEWKKLGTDEGSVFVLGVIEEEDGKIIDVDNTDIQFIS